MDASSSDNDIITRSLKEGIVTPENMRALIVAHPDQLKQPDSNNALPFHYACGTDFLYEPSGLIQSPEIIKMLLDAYPAAAEMKDKYGRTSLHRALAKGASIDIDIIKMHLDAYPVC